MCEKKQFVSFECLRTFYFQFLAAVNTAAVNILVQIDQQFGNFLNQNKNGG